jgi:hypothetical protein
VKIGGIIAIPAAETGNKAKREMELKCLATIAHIMAGYGIFLCIV